MHLPSFQISKPFLQGEQVERGSKLPRLHSFVPSEPEWEVLSSDTFDEPCYPSPAISGGRVDVRTESKLYCFAVK